MVFVFKYRCVVKVVSFLIIQSFLFTNIAFAAGRFQNSNYTSEEMLSPALSVDTSQLRSIVQQKVQEKLDDINAAVSFDNAQFMVEIDYIMRSLGISDYKRVIQIFRTSIDPVALVKELVTISGKNEEEILLALENIDFFKPHAAIYRVRNAEHFDPREFEGLQMDVSIKARGYVPTSSQVEVEGQPISDYLSLFRMMAPDVPFVFRDNMQDFVGRFLGIASKNTSNPDLLDIVNRIAAFLKKVDLAKLQYVVTSGIGANEMYSHQLAAALNAFFQSQGIKLKWIVVNNPAHLAENVIPSDAANENTIVFEMSRSGGTKETLQFFQATQDRFKQRIVAANQAKDKKENAKKLNGLAAELAKDADANVLIIDDTPGDIGGRQMNRKTLMTYAPLFIALTAGLKDINKGQEFLKVYVQGLFEANRNLDYALGKLSSAVQMAEFLFRHREAGRNKFSVVYDNSLRAASKELGQLLNEGGNKIIAGSTNNNILDSYSLTKHKDRYTAIFKNASQTQLPIFLLNKNSRDYNEAITYVKQLREEGIPVVVVEADLRQNDLANNLKVLARTSALLQDMVVYFTYITNQDANSNPAVKFVREITGAMFEILKSKKEAGEKDIRMSFEDVLNKIDENQEKAAADARDAVTKRNIKRQEYKADFNRLRSALQELADKLDLDDSITGEVFFKSIDRDVVATDVGEAGGSKIQETAEVFSRSLLNTLLGQLTSRPDITALDKQIVITKNDRVKISVAAAEDMQFTAKDTAGKIAEYLFAMYKTRQDNFQYFSHAIMEADADNADIAEIVDTIVKQFADLDVTSPALPLPGVAHTGIEAIMSHPENVFNLAILESDTYGQGLGTYQVEPGVSVDDATYVYGISNVIRMALGGSPSVIVEVKNSEDLKEVKQVLIDALKLFREKIDEKAPVWFFGRAQDGTLLTEGNKDMKALLGGKGANLAEMSSLTYELDGKVLPVVVPQGFTGTTEEAQAFFDNGNKLSDFHVSEIKRNLVLLEQVTGRKFGGTEKPLLLSCRSGARISMPGMMDTVLNIGLNDQTVEALAKEFKNERFAWDSYRRLIQMFSDVVMGIGTEYFEEVLEKKRKERNVEADYELTIEDLKDIVKKFKAYVREKTGYDFPQDPMDQLFKAYEAVYESSFTKRVIDYRRINRIPDDTLSAVNVQVMVFGNLNNNSATGVAFTRDPATGERVFYGEYLINAQGEDVVAGIRTPMPLNKANKAQFIKEHPEFKGREEEILSLEEAMPEVYRQLDAIQQALEEHYNDMQDIEFTVQDGVLYLLQTRDGKRTAFSALKILMALVNEGKIDKEEAVMRLKPEQLDEFLHPTFDPQAKEHAKKESRIIGKGLNASPGAAVGKVVFSADDAEEWAKRGEDVILVRPETVPDDIAGMEAAKGILTSKGGKTSHAAVVARGMGKTAVVGAGKLQIDLTRKRAYIEDGEIEIREGDEISIDGYTGEIILGRVATRDSVVKRGKQGETLTGDEQSLFDMFETFFEWVNEFRGPVRTNAEQAEELEIAFNWFGADGIGLARTEHMFFEKSRILDIQKAIIGGNIENITALEPYQRVDFYEMFKICDGRPAKIRLLDPPLHEFLPDPNSDDANKGMPRIELLANDPKLGLTEEEIIARIHDLEENNPMAGLRGDRLLILYPAFLDLQIRAMFRAYNDAVNNGIIMSPVEIMIPLVGVAEEADFFIDRIMELAEEYGIERYKDFKIGTMIEVPSAVIDAFRIAEKLDFFSAGTNDLHQFSFWFSRDDAGNVVIPAYMSEDKLILSRDPFNTVDADGVGEMLAIANALGKAANPDLKFGICGEQGGDSESIIKTILPAGLDYPSCSPFRLPVAMLSSAQANITAKRAGKPLAEPYDLSKIEPASLDIERVDVESTDQMMVSNQSRRILMRKLLLTEKNSKDEAEAAQQRAEVEKIEGALANLIQDEMKDILENNSNAFIRIFSRNLGSLFMFDMPIDAGGNGLQAELPEAEEITALYYAMYPEIAAIDDYAKRSDAKERALEKMKEKIKSYMEFNPSLGNRGVRAMLTNSPEIVRTQIKALSNLLKERRAYAPRIIIPLLINDQEFKMAKDLIVKWLTEEGTDPLRVKIGASIQTPEAALLAGRIAQYADFVIFDTEGMSESVIAVTKKDSKTFMDQFVAMGIYDINPFKILSEKNVGKYIGIAKRRVLETNPNIPVYLTGSVLLRRERPLHEAVLKSDVRLPDKAGVQDDKTVIEKIGKAI